MIRYVQTFAALVAGALIILALLGSQQQHRYQRAVCRIAGFHTLQYFRVLDKSTNINERQMKPLQDIRRTAEVFSMKCVEAFGE